MPSLTSDFTLILLKCVPLLFVFCFGACVGSLLNVLVYRLPAGLGVVTPPSRCPTCSTRLTWRENIPILGWLMLRGRCRFCKAAISPQYPLVELGVALMFVLVWMQLYFITYGTTWFGVSVANLSPDFARGYGQWEKTWPIYAVIVLLFAGLLASTMIDARTFTIPLEIPWACTLIGLVVHTLWAGVVQWKWGSLQTLDDRVHWSMSIPVDWAWPSAWAGVPGNVSVNGAWWWVGAAIGGAVGVGVSCLLMRLGWIRPSMADYDTWAEAELARQKEVAARAKEAGEGKGEQAGEGEENLVPIDPATGQPADPTELWTLYPYARREMVKELAFVAPIVVLALAGGLVMFKAMVRLPESASNGMQQVVFADMPPLWLLVMCGSILGYLLVGGVLWGVRILGTLGFGKEAMGMGDVHLMAAVGACLGWIDGTLAFFLSAPVALAGWLVGWVIARAGGSRKGTTLPFGPWLSIATVLVFVGKPLIEWGLTALMKADRPINLP